MPRKREISRSFAGVYDTLYDNPVFVARRTDFLLSVLGSEDGLLLDAGCGTGAQVDALREQGRCVVGLDLDPHMLTVAHWHGVNAPLVRGDLRRLPFRVAFGGILCLESPLAYLLDDRDFLLALRSLRRALLPRGRLIIESYDYLATFGSEASGPLRAWVGPVRVTEWHSYDAQTRTWTMRQRFAVQEEERVQRFEVMHWLKIRTPDEYAAALEDAGFEIEQMLDGYPDLPEKRIVVVAVVR